MKRTIFVLLIVAVLAAGVAVVYRARKVELSIEEVLPEGALIYVNVSDVEKKLEDFKATPLWQNIRNIDVEKLMQKSGLDEKQIGRYREAVVEISGFLPELLLDKCFGREIALAVYPYDIKIFNQETVREMASNIILVTRLKPGVEFVEFISKLCNKVNKEIVIKEETYRDEKGPKITVVELDAQLKIGYVKIGDLLVVGLGKKAATVCLDTASHKNRLSLSQDTDFSRARAKLPRQIETISYANLESLARNLRESADFIPAQAGFQKRELFEALDKFAGFKTVISVSLPGKISENRSILTFDKDKLNPPTAVAYSFKPQKNETIDFVPKDIIGYQWSNCFDAKSSWDNLLNQLCKKGSGGCPAPVSSEHLIENIENKLGLSIEKEIIPVLDNEIGGFLSDIDLTGPIPIPKFVFFLKVKNRERAENIISTLIEKNNIFMQAEDYKDKFIKYTVLPFGTGLQPGYCFLNDYLLVSFSSQLLKKTIDTWADKSASLVKNKNFEAINLGLLEKNNAVSFLDVNLLLERTEKICEWGVGWFSLASSVRANSLRSMEQDLEKLNKKTQAKEKELNGLKITLKSTEEEINKLREQNLDLSSKSQELGVLKKRIEVEEKQIEQAREELKVKRQQLEGQQARGRMDVSLVKLYLDELISPILEGLKIYKASGSRTLVEDGQVRIESFCKME